MKSRQSTMRTMLVLLSLCAITGVGIGGLRAAAPSDMPSLSLVVDTLIADATTAEDAPETAWASFHREGLVVWQVLGNMG